MRRTDGRTDGGVLSDNRADMGATLPPGVGWRVTYARSRTRNETKCPTTGQRQPGRCVDNVRLMVPAGRLDEIPAQQQQ